MEASKTQCACSTETAMLVEHIRRRNAKLEMKLEREKTTRTFLVFISFLSWAITFAMGMYFAVKK